MNTVEVYFNLNYLSSAAGVVVGRPECGTRGHYTENGTDRDACTSRRTAEVLETSRKAAKEEVYYQVHRPRSAGLRELHS